MFKNKYAYTKWGTVKRVFIFSVHIQPLPKTSG